MLSYEKLDERNASEGDREIEKARKTTQKCARSN